MPKRTTETAPENREEMLEQRKARYAKTKKETDRRERDNRKKEKEEKRTADRRLAFLQSIFKTLGYTQAKIAELSGTTQQAMSWYFSVKDDCRLSQAEQFLNVIGYSLKVEIINKKITEKKVQHPLNEGQNKGVRFRIEGDFENVLRWNGQPRPSYVINCPTTARMYWLAQYINLLNEPITQLMQRCEIDMSSLRYIFTKDDIKISQIFQIAGKTEGQITWKVNNIQKGVTTIHGPYL